MTETTNEDRELASAAKKKAGGATALARLLGVKKQTASGWGKTQPIPRHARPRLVAYVQHAPAPASELGPAQDVQGKYAKVFQKIMNKLNQQERELAQILAYGLMAHRGQDPGVFKLLVEIITRLLPLEVRQEAQIRAKGMLLIRTRPEPRRRGSS